MEGPQDGQDEAPRRGVWEGHFREREERWCRHDGLAAAVTVLALLVAALRVEKQLGAWETLSHTVLAAVALLVLSSRPLQGYNAWRNVAVVALRVGFCTSSIIQKHANRILLVGEPDVQDSMAAMSGALVRMLVGDHTALLAFLGWAWPVGTLSNALVQLACLYLVSRQNEAMCNSPYLRGASAGMMGDRTVGLETLALSKMQTYTHMPLLSIVRQPTEEQICRWYTIAIQLLLGFAAPVLYWGCSDVMAGVRYALEHNIDDSDRLHRLYRWLCRYVCPGHIAMFAIMATAAAILALAAAGLLMRGGA